MKIILSIILLISIQQASFAQLKKTDTTKASVLAFKDLIQPSVVADSGLINIYKQSDKFYWEIPNSIFDKDILIVSRISKGAANSKNFMIGYAGDEINNLVIRFSKGPKGNIFVRRIAVAERETDTISSLYYAIANSNLQPIVAVFNIKAFSENRKASVIDVTDYLNDDNDIFFFNPGYKSMLGLTGIQADKSYVVDVKSFANNIEIRTVKTYSKTQNITGINGGLLPIGSSGTSTLELNTFVILLPEQIMQSRFYDDRVGFFSLSFIDYDLNPQGVKKINLIKRWRLEPKEKDKEKYYQGELVEPKKPIVFYIDPNTPPKWVPYLMQGVNDWQVAFEQAGFKNAIFAKEAPSKDEDSTWSIEDSKYSAIVYKPSTVENASGPVIVDPRSGEILESHINWYHNMLNPLHYWYLLQASQVDSTARAMVFPDSLMGKLIRSVVSHEVGHALGLQHNFGSSSTIPVDSLRSKTWVTKYGHTPSIMDYARLNYVAQPEDSLELSTLLPRIGVYDKWAIEWGYKLYSQYSSASSERDFLNQLVIKKLSNNKRLWFGADSSPNDPRCQSEDLGDDAMKANTYAIKNLKWILPHLREWTKQPNEGYENFESLYRQLLNHYYRYAGHVAKYIGGTYETSKRVEEPGSVFETVPREKQKKAIEFLNENLFKTPWWIIDSSVLNYIPMSPIDILSIVQMKYLEDLTSSITFIKLIRAEAIGGKKVYQLKEYFKDLHNCFWEELKTNRPIDLFRRNLQKVYVEKFIKFIEKEPMDDKTAMVVSASSKLNDINSLVKIELKLLKNELGKAVIMYKDLMTKYHLQDCLERIEDALKLD